jgi:hypothetical protein
MSAGLQAVNKLVARVMVKHLVRGSSRRHCTCRCFLSLPLLSLPLLSCHACLSVLHAVAHEEGAAAQPCEPELQDQNMQYLDAAPEGTAWLA